MMSIEITQQDIARAFILGLAIIMMVIIILELRMRRK